MIDFTKPVRFTRVQSDEHATYRPRLIGSYRTPDHALRWVVCLRNWDSAVSFIVYGEDGKPISVEQAKEATKGTGIFDATLVNGPEIVELPGNIGGADVIVTFDGLTAVRARLA